MNSREAILRVSVIFLTAEGSATAPITDNVTGINVRLGLKVENKTSLVLCDSR